MKHIMHIMLIEDNEGDIILAKEALQHSKIKNRISVLQDGEKAIDFFNNHDSLGRKDSELPDLIILDINLPKVDGKDVLKEIKGNPRFKKIPVVMFTTSSDESDISFSYANYANCYVTKPLNLDQYMQAIREIEDFWFQTVQLPSNKQND